MTETEPPKRYALCLTALSDFRIEALLSNKESRNAMTKQKVRNNIIKISGSITFKEEIDAPLIIALFINPNTRKKEYRAATTASETLLLDLFTVIDEVSLDCSLSIFSILTRSVTFSEYCTAPQVLSKRVLKLPACAREFFCARIRICSRVSGSALNDSRTPGGVDARH